MAESVTPSLRGQEVSLEGGGGASVPVHLRREGEGEGRGRGGKEGGRKDRGGKEKHFTSEVLCTQPVTHTPQQPFKELDYK